MKNAHGKLGELTILDELAKMRQSFFLAIGDEFNQIEHCLDHTSLKVIATFVPKHS
jgi:hypothetical protein